MGIIYNLRLMGKGQYLLLEYLSEEKTKKITRGRNI